MLRTMSFTSLSTILQSINIADEDENSESESAVDETNLSNPSTSKRSTRVAYLTSKGAKRGGNNTKKSVKAAKDPDYPIPAAK